jgi:hypothetical protein
MHSTGSWALGAVEEMLDLEQQAWSIVRKRPVGGDSAGGVVEVGSSVEEMNQGPAAAALRLGKPSGAKTTCDRNIPQSTRNSKATTSLPGAIVAWRND